MLPFLSKKSAIRLRILGWYQIIGGIYGVLMILGFATHLDRVYWQLYFIALLLVMLYSFSIYSGWLLFKDKFIFGLKLSVINQCLQILGLTFVRFTYIYVAGMELFVTLDTANGFNLGLKYYLGSEATISFHSQEKPLFLGVNLIALILVELIIKLRDTIKQERAAFDELEVSDGSEEERLTYEE